MNALSSRRKVTILISCCLSLLIVSMDTTIVNVAIPSIRTELHASASELQWVIDVYTLVLASLLLLSGATADRFGRRRVFQIGLTIFAVGSLLCSVAPDIHTLIAARLLQGIGGSMLNPVGERPTGRCSGALGLPPGDGGTVPGRDSRPPRRTRRWART